MSKETYWTFSEKIRLLLDRSPKTAIGLAKFTGMSRGSVTRWIDGTAVANPTILHLVAEYFGVPVKSIDPTSTEVLPPFSERPLGDGMTALTLEEDDPPLLWICASTGEVKVVSERYFPVRVASDCPLAGKADLMKVLARRWLGTEVPKTSVLDALTVEDTTMAPTIEEHSLLIYEKTGEIGSPGVYVIEINGKPGVRRVSFSSAGFVVSCDNKNYPTITESKLKVIGRAIKVITAVPVQ